MGSFLVKKWSHCQWQASKAYVLLSKARVLLLKASVGPLLWN